LFAGTLDYQPNAKAVRLIFKEIAPRLDDSFTILICGRNDLKEFESIKHLAQPNVLFIGEVEDIEHYFAAADAFLDPVETGGGVQSKIIEALGYDLNVVCFDSQADKQFELAGEKIFPSASGDYDGIVKNINRSVLSSSPTLPQFFKYYNWESIIKRLNEKLTAGNE
jgi:polysaccharide biosynthesis protein PslH